MAQKPKHISGILSELMAQRGYARVTSTEACESAWKEAAGPIAAEYTRVGTVRRGRLEVMVANSTLVQELVFRKQDLLQTLNQHLPDQPIQDLRFRVGPIK